MERRCRFSSNNHTATWLKHIDKKEGLAQKRKRFMTPGFQFFLNLQ
jgi:hypothetical protein